MRGHEHFIVLAVVAAVSARLGSELASRWQLIFTAAGGVSRVLKVPQVWWIICGAALVAALIDGSARANQLTTPVRVSTRARRRSLLVIALVFAAHGATEWHRLATPRVGEYSGIVIARSDAVAKNNTTTLVVEVERENFRIVARGRSRNALHHVRMGDVLLVDGTRVAYDERRLRFVAGRHVQGEFQQVVVHATGPSPTPWHRAANRIHDLIDRGSRTMPSDDAALVRGLVLGDESRQPSRMTEAFRAAGLGHLLAVSGQNVVLILAALTPGLQRLTRWSRLATALGLVAMFAVVTRLESSVVRACVMAAVTQVGFTIGRDLLPLRALALTVAGIVAVDPLATWSIGFVLSVAATAGLIVVTPWLGETIFAATAAAQLAVSPFVVWWFGSVPSLALIANVVAVPAASLVMVIGPPLLVIAAFLPDSLAELVSIPIIIALRWVWWVAEWGLRLSPPSWLNVLAWVGIVVYVVKRTADEVRYVGHPSARL
ncbi:MAG: ComEC/Rec2 family competence protein [Ilumatobacteraceae bacterium]